MNTASIALAPIGKATAPAPTGRTLMQAVLEWFSDDEDDVRDAYLGQADSHADFALRTRDWAEYEARAIRMYSHGCW